MKCERRDGKSVMDDKSGVRDRGTWGSSDFAVHEREMRGMLGRFSIETHTCWRSYAEVVNSVNRIPNFSVL